MLGELSIRAAYIEGGIISVIPLPFCLLTLVVLAYYIRRRIHLYQEINRIPSELTHKAILYESQEKSQDKKV